MEAYLRKLLTRNGDWYSKDGFSNSKPGSIFEYSNVATSLAAQVLEYATGTPYQTFSTQHILTPLKMQSTVGHWKP